MPLLLSLFSNTESENLISTVNEEKRIRDIRIGKEKKSIFSNEMIVYIEKP